MKHTAKRRALAQRPFSISITPFLEHPKKSADFSGAPFREWLTAVCNSA